MTTTTCENPLYVQAGKVLLPVCGGDGPVPWWLWLLLGLVIAACVLLFVCLWRSS